MLACRLPRMVADARWPRGLTRAAEHQIAAGPDRTRGLSRYEFHRAGTALAQAGDRLWAARGVLRELPGVRTDRAAARLAAGAARPARASDHGRDRGGVRRPHPVAPG